jgi:hypothetical protein
LRARVVEQLVEEAQSGGLTYQASTRHLLRAPGACVFCPMLEIGPCDYTDELEPLVDAPHLTADSAVADLQAEKEAQVAMLDPVLRAAPPVHDAWAGTDETAVEVEA